MQQLTDEQFTRALKFSTICTNNGWNFSTEIIIAKMIATSSNKEEIITQIEKIIYTNDKQDFLNKLSQIGKK